MRQVDPFDNPFNPDLTHPTKMVVRFIRKGDESKRPPALVELDRLGEMMDRGNREFGDPTKFIGGPKLPAETIVQGKRRRAA